MGEHARKVLLLAGRLGSLDDGRPLVSFLNRVQSQGVEVRVLCSAREGNGDPRIIEWPGLGHRWHRALAVRRLRFGETLERPDLLHVLQNEAAPAGLAIAEHWSLPYLQTVDEFLAPRERLRLSRRLCVCLVAASRDLACELSTNYAVPETMLSVVPPAIAVPAKRFNPAVEVGNRVPVIGTAGPLTAASGFASFLSAVRRVLDSGVDAEFVIAGQGEAELDLRRRADRLRISDRVTFAAQPIVGLRFWNVLDIYVQTALAPTVGRTLAWAMASGAPAIASDIDGLRSLIVHDETGLLIPPDDSAALAGAILSLLRDPARAERLGTSGRAAIERDFDPDDEARKLAELYRSIPLAEEAGRIRMPCAPRIEPVAISRLSRRSSLP